jgi:hypothetical protein
MESSGVAPMGKVIDVEDMVLLLRDIVGSVRAGDSMEGSLAYELDEPGKVRFMCAYRIGNSQGQGGMRLVRDEEAQAALPIEPLPEVGSLWHVPRWEADWSGPWKVHLARRHEISRPGAITLTKAEKPDLAHTVPDYCWPFIWVPWEAEEIGAAKEVKNAA